MSDDTVIWSAFARGSDEFHGYRCRLPSGGVEDLGLIPGPPASYDESRFAYTKMIQGQARDEVYLYDIATKQSTLTTASGGSPSLRGRMGDRSVLGGLPRRAA